MLFITLLIASCLVAAGLIARWQNRRPTTSQEATVDSESVASNLSTFAKFPATCLELNIENRGATITILRSTNVRDICVAANQPRNWTVRNGSIRHTPPWANSARVEIKITNGELFVNGKLQMRDALVVTVPAFYKGRLNASTNSFGSIDIGDWSGGSISIENSGTGYINAKNLKNLSNFTMIGTSMGDIFVKSVSANLAHVELSGSGKATVKNLVSDSLTLTSSSSSPIELNELKIKFYATIKLTGSGNVTLDSIDSSSLTLTSAGMSTINAGIIQTTIDTIIRLSGSGDFAARSVKSSMLEATTMSMGKIIIYGADTKSSELVTNGSGDIIFERLATESLKAKSTGMGKVLIDGGQAASGAASTSGMGDIVLRGSFSAIRPSSHGMGRVRFS